MRHMIHKSKEEMKIALCEDNPEQLLYHKKVLESVVQKWNVTFLLFHSGEELLTAMELGEEFDVLFLDIEMKNLDGIETGKRVRAKKEDMILIYLTAYQQYALKAYETKAFRYLLKPFDEKTAQEIMNSVYKEISRFEKLIFKDNERTYFVEISKVLYLEANNKVTYAYTQEEEYSGIISLTEYEKFLESYGFFRIHRKYLVNSYYVKEMRSDMLLLDEKIELPIARNKRKSIKEAFAKALERGIC